MDIHRRIQTKFDRDNPRLSVSGSATARRHATRKRFAARRVRRELRRDTMEHLIAAEVL